MERGYQYDFSLAYESMNSVEGRQRKAATMIAVLREALGERLAHASLLNLGCSTGIIDEYLAAHVASATGVDIDEPGIALANSRRKAQNLRFEVGDAMQLRFAPDTFDVVICSQVYEHVPDPVRMLDEIRRVLKPGGVCYFAATNRWALIERHYRLPFLSWLPPRAADAYMRLARKGDRYYERHLSYGKLLALTSALRRDEYTGRILDDPERYGAGYMFGSALTRFVARTLFRLARPIFPSYIWLLWKDGPKPAA